MTSYRTLALATLGLLAALCSAQTHAFAVASVKLNTSTHNGIGNKFGPDSVRWTNVPLKVLIEETYHLKNYQIAGGAAWVDSDRWDIDAKSDGPASSAEKNEMLGTLMAERFALKFHREIRQLPILQLSVAKAGPKFTTAKPQDADHRWGTRVDRGLLAISGGAMEELAFWLSSQLDQPVEDHTGLTGRYDLKLEWAQDEKPTAAADVPLTPGDLPISAAVESELGLRLTATKGPVEILVIDHAERAAGN